MGQDIYHNLMKHLGNVGIGYPQMGKDDFIKVLRKKITPEEAEIALGLPTRLPPFEVEEVEVIARRIGKPADKVEEILAGLAKKGFLFKQKTALGKTGYAFIQIGFGIPQLFMWKGEPDDHVKEEIARPMYKYLKEGGWDAQNTKNVRLFRYVPVNLAVDRSVTAVYSYDMMKEVIQRARRIAVCHCPCRMAGKLFFDTKCKHSLENCIKFNKMADYALEHGLGREISREEALEITRKAEEEGLIHFVDNCQGEIQHNCNCCSCCCCFTMPIKNRLVPRDSMMATYYLRTTDEEACTGCGQCADDCPLEIITIKDDKPVVDESICIGCGVCLLHCPTGAAKVKEKDESVPFPDFTTLHHTALQDVGKGKEG
ncbi:MAG: 4Fe-4S binding protein [Pseudomonadota bacterium]